MQGAKLRNYLITFFPRIQVSYETSLSNGYTPEALETHWIDAFTQWCACIEDSAGGDIMFACGQLELCPSTQRFHYQCYFEFRKSIRVAGIKKLLSEPSIHCDARGGTQEEAIEYCTRESKRFAGEPWEYGTRAPGRGHRSDLSGAVAALRATPSMACLAESHPNVFVKYHRGFEKLITYYITTPDRPVKVTTLWGPTGVGKSRKVFASHPSAYWWPRPQNAACYAMGYTGQLTVVLDDFYSWLPYDLLLRVLDRYPLTVNTMGGVQQFLATEVYITSNMDPREWYPGVENKSALMRRLTEEDSKIIHMTEEVLKPPVSYDRECYGSRPSRPCFEKHDDPRCEFKKKRRLVVCRSSDRCCGYLCDDC